MKRKCECSAPVSDGQRCVELVLKDKAQEGAEVRLHEVAVRKDELLQRHATGVDERGLRCAKEPQNLALNILLKDLLQRRLAGLGLLALQAQEDISERLSSGGIRGAGHIRRPITSRKHTDRQTDIEMKIIWTPGIHIDKE